MHVTKSDSPAQPQQEANHADLSCARMFRLTHLSDSSDWSGDATESQGHRPRGNSEECSGSETAARASELTRVARSTTSRHATRDFEGIVSKIELRVAQTLFTNPRAHRRACATIPPLALTSRPGTPFLSERKCSVVVVVGVGGGEGWSEVGEEGQVRWGGSLGVSGLGTPPEAPPEAPSGPGRS